MSPYAEELANARLDALRTLLDALKQAETPDEKRRCAVAIFNAPDPCDLDDAIELDDDPDDPDDPDDTDDAEDADDIEDSEDEKDDDDVNGENEDSSDDDTLDHTTDAVPSGQLTSVPPTIAALSDRRCDGATTAPPDPAEPFA